MERSLQALSNALQERGSRLLIREGKAGEVVHELVREAQADAVYWNRLYEPAEIERDTNIKQSLRDADISAQSFQANLLLEPWTVETKTAGPYRVFTPFWRSVLERLPGREPLAMPRNLRPPAAWPDGKAPKELKLTPEIPWDAGFWEHWTPGEEGARKQLYRFAAGALVGYKQQRDVPASDGVSRLSPHLHFGEVSPFQIWKIIAARRKQSPADVECFLREIGWREFAHHILFHFPHTPEIALNPKYRDFPWRADYEPMLTAWKRGRTGIPLVDAGMRELWQTGWMHNRVRMIVASFLVKNVRAPWLAGARWFEDTLLDADLAANTMGWQWAAGCGADAAPYFRVFNPVLQGRKFDPDGDYIRKYIPELRPVPTRYIHAPWELPDDLAAELDFKAGKDYPAPIVDLASSRLDALAALKSLGSGEA